MRRELTAERLRALLHYDPNTGEWTWLISQGSRRRGSKSEYFHDGYRVIRVDGKLYRASRLAVLHMTGEWPVNEVDHRDTIRSNDKWLNLRLANRSENQSNIRKHSDNTSGFKCSKMACKNHGW